MVRFHTSNHKLPIETGRCYNIDLDDRKLPLFSTNTLGDEFHYLLESSYFNTQQRKYIGKRFHKRPNILLFKSLLTNQDANLGIFMGIILKQFATWNDLLSLLLLVMLLLKLLHVLLLLSSCIPLRSSTTWRYVSIITDDWLLALNN